MIAAYIGYCLVPSLIGFYFGLVVVKRLMKTKLIRLLKVIAFVVSWFWSTVITFNFFYDWGDSGAVVPIVVSFVVTLSVGMVFKKKPAQ
jgi:hypothetical protein